MILKNGKRIDGCTDTLPIGTVQPFLGLTPPKGYLLCQGQAVSKTVYSELYAICGDLFGQSTETEFFLPDLRGKTIAGYNENDGAMNTIGKLLGSGTHVHTTGNHTLTPNEIPDHQHYLYYNAITSGDWKIISASGMSRASQAGDFAKTSGVADYSTGQAHNHGNTGEASNYQPTIVLNWIVKAAMLIPEYFIVENTLTSISTGNALSAAQGKVLNNRIDNLIINNASSTSTKNAYSCNYVNELLTYSAEERRVGTWIDGKPLYQVTINVGTMPNATTSTYYHNIANVDHIHIDLGNSYLLEPTNNNNTSPFTNNWDIQESGVYVSKQVVGVTTTTDYSDRTGIFTLRYTKTTD